MNYSVCCPVLLALLQTPYRYKYTTLPCFILPLNTSCSFLFNYHEAFSTYHSLLFPIKLLFPILVETEIWTYSVCSFLFELELSSYISLFHYFPSTGLWSSTNVSALLYQIFRILGIMILSPITLPFKLIASSQILLPPLGRMPFILQLVHLTMFRLSFKFNRKNGAAVLYRATLGLIIFLSICRCITANVSVLLYQLFVKVWVMICPCQFFQNHLFLADSVILVQNCDFHFPFRICQCFAILLNTAEKRWFVGWRLPEFPPQFVYPLETSL